MRQRSMNLSRNEMESSFNKFTYHLHETHKVYAHESLEKRTKVSKNSFICNADCSKCDTEFKLIYINKI